MNDRASLVLGLSLALLFPLLVIGVGFNWGNNGIPEGWDASLQVGYGVSSISTEYTHIEPEELEHLPQLQAALGDEEHPLAEYDGVEAYRAVYYLSHVKGLEDRRQVQNYDGRVVYVYMVEYEERYTYLTIVFEEP